MPKQKKVPNILVSEQPDPEAITEEEVGNEQHNTDDEHDSWQRQEAINHRNTTAIRKLEESTLDINRKIDNISEILTTVVQELKNLKTATQKNGQEENFTANESRTPLYVPPFQRTSTRNQTEIPHSPDHSPNTNPRTAAYNDPSRTSLAPHTTPRLLQNTIIKLDFPTFNGDDRVIEWLRQVEQIFRYHGTPEIEWVQSCPFT